MKRLWKGIDIPALIVVVSAVFAGYGLYVVLDAALDSDPPIIFERTRALERSVAQGDTIDLEFSVFRVKVCDTQIMRWLVDSNGERHAVSDYTDEAFGLAGYQTFRQAITIPDAMAVGPAYYIAETDYSCNIVNRLGWPIHATTPPIRFDVTRRPIIILPPPELTH